jgi:hypothetical protein
LPKDLDARFSNLDSDFEREQFILEIDYWSTTILITRPCLCRLERRIQNQSDNSAKFNAKTSEACVNAALEITKLFPDQPSIDFIYSKGPWWAIIHISKCLSSEE